MKLWITRTRPEADETAARVRAMGHEAMVAPVLEVRPLDPSGIDLGGAGALAFTSVNGVLALNAGAPSGLPIFAVGARTAEAAAAVGGPVRSADGDVDDLVRLILAHRDEIHGVVVHIGPKEPAGDLVGALTAAGMAARRCAAYETFWTAAPAPPGIDGVLIHSAKAARGVAATLTPERAADIRLYAISERAARPLAALKFRHVAVAPYPNEAALLKLIDG